MTYGETGPFISKEAVAAMKIGGEVGYADDSCSTHRIEIEDAVIIKVPSTANPPPSPSRLDLPVSDLHGPYLLLASRWKIEPHPQSPTHLHTQVFHEIALFEHHQHTNLVPLRGHQREGCRGEGVNTEMSCFSKHTVLGVWQ